MNVNRHVEIHCSLCHRTVDAETRRRARHAFEPLIVCHACVVEADTRWLAGTARVAVAA